MPCDAHRPLRPCGQRRGQRPLSLAGSSRLATLDPSPSRFPSRALALSFAVLVAAFGFLPIANWISAGQAAPWYSAVVAEWVNGSAIVLGIAIVLAIASRRVNGLWR